MSVMAQSLVTSPHHRALKLAAPVFAGLLLISACSKKEDPPATSSSGASTTNTAKPGGNGSAGTAGAGSDTTVAGGTTKGTKKEASGDSIAIADTVIWMTGFKVTFPDGKYDKTEETLTFTDVEIENLSNDNASFYGTYSLEADGAVVYSGGNWKENKSVIAKSKTKDTLVFSGVDEEFDPSITTLVLGTGSEAQVRIPFGDEGELVARKPLVQEFKGKLAVGLADIDVATTEVRWDRPDNHTQAEKGKAFVIVSGKVKNTGDTTLYWDAVKAVLIRPDATKTGAAQVVGGGSVSATQIDDKWAIVWEIDEPIEGAYTMEFTQPFGPEGAEVVVTQEFTVAEKSTSTEKTTTTKK